MAYNCDPVASGWSDWVADRLYVRVCTPGNVHANTRTRSGKLSNRAVEADQSTAELSTSAWRVSFQSRQIQQQPASLHKNNTVTVARGAKKKVCASAIFRYRPATRMADFSSRERTAGRASGRCICRGKRSATPRGIKSSYSVELEDPAVHR